MASFSWRFSTKMLFCFPIGVILMMVYAWRTSTNTPGPPANIFLHSNNRSSIWEQQGSTHHTTTTVSWHPNTQKMIVMPSRMYRGFPDGFRGCEFSNCQFQFTDNVSIAVNGDLFIFEHDAFMFNKPEIKRNRQDDKLWIAFTLEPPPKHPLRKSFNQFNGTMTYKRDSDIVFPYERLKLKTANEIVPGISEINYAKGKIKGAYAYVSNCHYTSYPRLTLMKELSKHVNLDIYGKCTGDIPCNRGGDLCEIEGHKEYRFYLSFENSICADYITEKFWKTLRLTGNFVPVVLGGLSIEDYSRVAPPNSFIHAYNFSSVKELGAYLSHLMDDDVAYNKYHEWRETHKIVPGRVEVACDLCHLAHNPLSLRKNLGKKFADLWNDPKNCRSLPPGYM